jgi:hypothetical protein
MQGKDAVILSQQSEPKDLRLFLMLPVLSIS